MASDVPENALRRCSWVAEGDENGNQVGKAWCIVHQHDEGTPPPEPTKPPRDEHDQPASRPTESPVDRLKRPLCVINRCGRRQGNGTWCQVVGVAHPQPVCEEHWQALRGIFPKERSDA